MTTDIHETTSLLGTVTDALNSASFTLKENVETFLPPTDGISLLDIKNELLLSYLQNLAFLVLLRVRDLKDHNASKDGQKTQLLQKLTQLRVYIERGVRPLEGRLKYQIDSTLRAAENAQLRREQKEKNGQIKSQNNDKTDDEPASDSDSDSDTTLLPTVNNAEVAALSHGPRLHLTQAKARLPSHPSKDTSSSRSKEVYKPPRLNPTAMPSTDPQAPSGTQRNRRSHLLSEYIDEEMSAAPLAVPSIGANATHAQSGRNTTSTSRSAIAAQRERTEYEERNFTRLPNESKAEKRKRKQSEAREGGRDVFGGEDWTGLGGLGDRIERGTKGGRKEERESILHRREKRARATEDGPRGSGLGEGIGEVFEKKRRVMEGRSHKKRR